MGAAAIPAGIALAGAGVSAYEGGVAGKAQAGYYGYLADTAKTNAGLAKSEAISKERDIGAQANQEQVNLTNRVNETIGAQKTAMVSGVGASSRSAQDIIGDTLDKGNLDEMALRLNTSMASRNVEITAKSRGLNFGNEASGDLLAGGNALNAARMGQVSSLLSGAGSVANSWYLGKMYAGRGYTNPDSAGDNSGRIGSIS